MTNSGFSDKRIVPAIGRLDVLITSKVLDFGRGRKEADEAELGSAGKDKKKVPKKTSPAQHRLCIHLVFNIF